MYKEKDYKNIYYLLMNNKLIGYKKYQELVPYEYILHYLISDTVTNNFAALMKNAMDLVFDLKDDYKYLDSSIIDLCSSVHSKIHSTNLLRVLFRPKEVIKKYGFGFFLTSFNEILKESIDVRNKFKNMTYRYPKFNDAFQYISNYCSLKGYNSEELDIVITILARIYVDELDYVILDEYLIDPDYYKMNGLNFTYFQQRNYYSKIYKDLYDNADSILNKNTIAIR